MNLNIGELLNQSIGEDEVSQISNVIGEDPQTTGSAISAALPVLLGGMSQNASNADGAASLLGAVDRDHDGSVLNDIGGYLGGGGGQGQGILDHIFGNRTDAIQQGVSRASGMDISKVAMLLPLLAPLVMGVLGRARQSGQVDQESLAGLLGQGQASLGGGEGLMSALSQLLDQNHDGSVVDDVGGLLGGLLGGRR
jgi:hypothetical protein